jgi:hypothetical protein
MQQRVCFDYCQLVTDRSEKALLEKWVDTAGYKALIDKQRPSDDAHRAEIFGSTITDLNAFIAHVIGKAAEDGYVIKRELRVLSITKDRARVLTEDKHYQYFSRIDGKWRVDAPTRVEELRDLKEEQNTVPGNATAN